MSGYIGTQPVPQATQTRDVFTATSGQTTFATSGYTPNFLDVWLNGVKLVNGDDFTATNGSDVVLTSGATTGDTVEVLSYSTYEVNAQTYTGGLTVNNNAATVLTVDRATSDGTLVDFKKDGSTVGSIGVASGQNALTIGNADTGLSFQGNQNDAIFPYNVSTNALRDGAVSLGYSSSRFKDLHLSGTIKWLDGAAIPVPTNTIGVAGNTTAGNSGLYWINLESKGGTHVVLNTDGTRTTSRNVEDHFTVWQKANNQTDGRLAFSVDNAGGAVFGSAGVVIDRGWSNYPSITVMRNSHNGDDNTFYNEFRVHGQNWNADTWWGGAAGADFSVNFRIDGGAYITSDRRKKAKIESLTSAIDTVMQLDGKRFQLTNSEGTPEANMSKSGFKMGFIAQDIEDIIPDAVKHYPDEDDGTEGYNNAYSVDYASIVALLTNAIKEQQATIQALEARISAIETQGA